MTKQSRIAEVGTSDIDISTKIRQHLRVNGLGSSFYDANLWKYAPENSEDNICGCNHNTIFLLKFEKNNLSFKSLLFDNISHLF